MNRMLGWVRRAWLDLNRDRRSAIVDGFIFVFYCLLGIGAVSKLGYWIGVGFMILVLAFWLYARRDARLREERIDERRRRRAATIRS